VRVEAGPFELAKRPTSPANAGAQIHPVRLGMTRHHAALNETLSEGSIWVPALAGKVGFLEGWWRLLPTRSGRREIPLSLRERDSLWPPSTEAV
jgi:hypothetical protein